MIFTVLVLGRYNYSRHTQSVTSSRLTDSENLVDLLGFEITTRKRPGTDTDCARGIRVLEEIGERNNPESMDVVNSVY